MMDNLGDIFGNLVSGFSWGAKIIDEDDLICCLGEEVIGPILNILMLSVIQGDEDKMLGLYWDIILRVFGRRNMQLRLEQYGYYYINEVLWVCMFRQG